MLPSSCFLTRHRAERGVCRPGAPTNLFAESPPVSSLSNRLFYCAFGSLTSLGHFGSLVLLLWLRVGVWRLEDFSTAHRPAREADRLGPRHGHVVRDVLAEPLNAKPWMLAEQPPRGSRLARLCFQRRGKQVNHRAIEGFRGDHCRLLDIDLQKMQKQAVPAQLFPLFDRELGDELLI